MFIPGRISQFIIFLVLCFFMLSALWLSKRKPIFRLRKIAPLDAIEEVVGRCAEMGRPLLMVPGIEGITAQTLAGLTVVNYATTLAARYDVEPIMLVAVQDVYPLALENVRLAFQAEGKADKFRPEMVRFVYSQFPMATTAMGIINRQRVAGTVMVGGFYAETLMILENAYRAGAVQVGGTANYHNIPFFVAVCDYALIGEEIFAASAYLSKDPEQIGTIVGEDFGRLFLAVLAFIGAILATLGATYGKWFTDLLSI